MEFIDLKSQQALIKDKIDKRIRAVLDHGKYIMGPEVYELEKRLSEYAKTKFCLTCSSGTDALLIPLLAKKIGPGDAIITTPFTYIATAEVISLLKATPIFIDIYPTTFNLDPSNIESAIDYAKQKNLKPKAIIAVDLFGLPARYRLIKKIAKDNDLFLIEDAAQSFGANISNVKSGKFGDVSSTSFFPAKPLGCYGDGGAIFTDDEDLAEIMKSIRVHGSNGNDKYNNVRIGINGRLDTIQAAILIEKLKIFNSELFLRKKISDYYDLHISNNFTKQYIPKNYFTSRAQYSLLASSPQHRKKIMESLKKNNIPSMIYYKIPLHLQSVFKNLGYEKGSLRISENISQRIFSLPMHPYLKRKDQDMIIKLVNDLQQII